MAAYRGEYLQEYPYEEWSSELRERLLTTFLQVAERLARMLAAAAESAAGAEPEPWDEIILLCQAILARDLCWEQAYRLQMLAYSRQGRRVQALRTYQRCRESLHAELGLAPGEATRQLYRAIRTPGDRSELWRLVDTA